MSRTDRALVPTFLKNQYFGCSHSIGRHGECLKKELQTGDGGDEEAGHGARHERPPRRPSDDFPFLGHQGGDGGRSHAQGAEVRDPAQSIRRDRRAPSLRHTTTAQKHERNAIGLPAPIDPQMDQPARLQSMLVFKTNQIEHTPSATIHSLSLQVAHLNPRFHTHGEQSICLQLPQSMIHDEFVADGLHGHHIFHDPTLFAHRQRHRHEQVR